MKRNFSSFIAMVVGMVLVFWSISISDGNVMGFVDLPSFIITLVGSSCALTVSYPLKDLLKIPSILKNVFITPTEERGVIIDSFIDLSKKARKDGLLSLEDELVEYEDDFLKNGLQLVIDGMEPETLQEILELEMENTQRRHKIGQDIFATWGELAPAFGMLGTLIGLIIMLADLDDPSSIGSGMATALITTFYGSLLANLIFIPIASNLKSKTEKEMVTREMMIEGLLALQSGVNPRVIEQRLVSYLPPQEKEVRLENNISEGENAYE